ncbi:unnamed protein product [Polarella glacialis]|uniref:NAD-dependent epimerase/dehydratase domain-containing protein n=1 Tax=Polarella glacialis TaxID=89957 RepID=A0A813LNN6_POLGL|nr:unnamed protein product [Polarella glacialis]
MDVARSEEVQVESPHFVLLGPSGFLGSAILKSLEAGGYRVLCSSIRLQDRPGLERLLDASRPSLGLVCAAGERGRPNISWCEDHPVETMDANITGQLSVAAACHARGIHVTLMGTGALYSADPQVPGRVFNEEDPPNTTSKLVYTELRKKMEELLVYFDNALTLRVLYPVSSDLDSRGLIGKLARFEQVHKVQTSVTVLDDLCPLIPELVRRRTTGVLNFVNSGMVTYTDVVSDLAKRAPPSWRRPLLGEDNSRAAAELGVARLAAACGREVPDALSSLQRIISGLTDDELQTLAPQQSPL